MDENLPIGKRTAALGSPEIDNTLRVCSCYVLCWIEPARLPMHLVHNERTKLTAAWLNTLATALVAAGAFAPAAALLYGLSPFALGAEYVIAIALGCFGLGGALHLGGRAFLGSLLE